MSLCTKAVSGSWVAHHSSQTTGSVFLPTIIWKKNPEIVHAMRSLSLDSSGLSYLCLPLVEGTIRNHSFSSYTSANSGTKRQNCMPDLLCFSNKSISINRATGSKRNYDLGFSCYFHRGTPHGYSLQKNKMSRAKYLPHQSQQHSTNRLFFSIFFPLNCFFWM